jgi:hypothetical protein
MSFGINLGVGLGAGGGILTPAAQSDIVQKLNITVSGGVFTAVTDDLDTLTVPTIVSNEVRQSDAFFTSGTVNFYSDNGSTVDDRGKAEFDTKYNSINGSHGLWIRINGSVYKAYQYPLDQDFTPAEVLRNEAYFGGTSGALRDGGGDLITDVNGFVVFTS